MKSPAEATRNNGGSGKGHISITAQINHTRKPWNNRQLEMLKSWHNVVQEYQIGQLWFGLEGAADIEDARMTI